MNSHHVLALVGTTEFLQTVSLLVSRAKRANAESGATQAERLPAITAKRGDILDLSRNEYEVYAPEAERGYVAAARFLLNEGIFAAHEVPYGSQLAPLAAILSVLREKAEYGAVRAKIAQWFWCGVFGELYSGTTETRMGRDLPEVLAWIDGGPQPSTVLESQFTQSRLRRLRMRISAAYKGIHALTIQSGGRDLRSGEPISIGNYFEQKYDIHHIFPARWCREQGLDKRLYDSVINKTPISYQTNRSIGGFAPSEYLKRLEGSISRDALDHALESHFIDPMFLRANDFTGFMSERENQLLTRIGHAMGKEVIWDVSEGYVESDTSDDDEELTDGLTDED